MAQPLIKKDDDRDEEAEYSPFLGIEKGAVLQEARVFNDPQLDPRRCSQVITKLLYLLNQGENFTKIEATEVFFAVTKLFQSRDIGLRRMVYLMIKEISPSADEVNTTISSLMKDMNSKTDMYRANSIRVLCRITDGTLLTQIERYLKQAIVDKNPVVASAALVSGIHLLQTNPEIVKRWSNEVQEAVQSRAALVQFHALALLHQKFYTIPKGIEELTQVSAPVELTEAETEYAVNVVKHIFNSHVVFQYNCTNTIPEQLLENVTVVVDASEAEEFTEVISKPLRSLPYDSPGQTFVAFEKPEGISAVGKFSNMLRFIVKEVDPSTGEAEEDGVEDEYQLEDLEVVAADYMLKVGVSNFKNAWESLGPDCERVDEYGLGARESLAEAVGAVINLLGMQPCESLVATYFEIRVVFTYLCNVCSLFQGTEVVPSNSRSHTCLLSGVYYGDVKVLVRLSFGIDSSREVAMKLAARSDDEDVSDAIHEIVACG
ncbi:Coatomer subunit gamma-2, partial [Cucurbita argyrosperma subsp. argyrosperma]